MQFTNIILLSLALVWLAANIWITKRVRKVLPAGKQRNLLIIEVWCLPYLGSFFAYFELQNMTREPIWKTPQKLPKGFLRDSPPALSDAPEIHIPGVPSFSIRDNLHMSNGLPVLNWQKFQEWLGAINDPVQKQQAMQAGHRAWLLFMRQAIGPHCFLYESDCAWVLATMEPNVLIASARFIASTKARIQNLLGEMARFPAGTKSILLVFDDDQTYKHYHSIYNPQSDPLHQSSGMFFDIASCPHFVVKRADLLQVEPVITHELVHNALQWLDIPLWLNEGLAVSVERRLHRTYADFSGLGNLEENLQAYWHARNIQEFWAGASFHDHDEVARLSYELAHVLVENMANGQEKSFSRFVCTAQRQDAGALAAHRELALDLGAAVCTLLGYPPGQEWAPRL